MKACAAAPKRIGTGAGRTVKACAEEPKRSRGGVGAEGVGLCDAHRVHDFGPPIVSADGMDGLRGNGFETQLESDDEPFDKDEDEGVGKDSDEGEDVDPMTADMKYAVDDDLLVQILTRCPPEVSRQRVQEIAGAVQGTAAGDGRTLGRATKTGRVLLLAVHKAHPGPFSSEQASVGVAATIAQEDIYWEMGKLPADDDEALERYLTRLIGETVCLLTRLAEQPVNWTEEMYEDDADDEECAD